MKLSLKELATYKNIILVMLGDCKFKLRYELTGTEQCDFPLAFSWAAFKLQLS